MKTSVMLENLATVSQQHMKYTYDLILRRVRAINVAVKKKINITYSRFAFVALVMQHATRMRHIVICDLSGSAIFFLPYLTNSRIFEKNKILLIIERVLVLFTNLPETFPIIRRSDQKCLLVFM
jgi:hypothetical protein